MKSLKQKIILPLALFLAFIIFTLLVKFIDVQTIGPEGSSVGFASINGWFHSLTGVNLGMYNFTDIISLLPFAIVAGFALIGLVQWIRRKHLLKVDPAILALGAFYILVFASYAAFEFIKINYRPTLIDGVLETSYPSSTTMLAICVFGSAMMLIPRYLSGWQSKLTLTICGLLLGFMVIVRLLSGVHWLTDILGGVLLSAALLTTLNALISCFQQKLKRTNPAHSKS